MVDSTFSVSNMRVRYPWMFGSAADICFLFLPIAFGFALCICARNDVYHSAFWTILIANAFGAGPFHQGATWFAYADKLNRKQFVSSLRNQTVFFAAPTIIVAISVVCAIFAPALLMFITIVWSLQHIVQQNLGILLLYHNHGRGEAVVPRVLEVRTVQMAGLTFGLIFAFRLLLKGAGGEVMIPLILSSCAYTGYLWYQYLFTMMKCWRNGDYLNVPALLFWVASILVLTPVAFFGKNFEDGYIIPVTAHWFQYIVLNYVLVKNKYGTDRIADLPVTRPIALFVALCTITVIVMVALMFIRAVVPSHSLTQQVLMGVVLGLGNAHYFIDAFLWRFREKFQRDAVLPYLMVGRHS